MLAIQQGQDFQVGAGGDVHLPQIDMGDLDIDTVVAQSLLSSEELAGLGGQGDGAESDRPGSGELPVEGRQTRTRQNKRMSLAQQPKSSGSDATEDKECDEDRALEVLRDKNRRAQRKSRERQKQKLEQSEARARDLEHSLQRLKLEKSALEARAALLERLLNMPGDVGRPPPLPGSEHGSGQGEERSMRAHTPQGQVHRAASFQGSGGGFGGVFGEVLKEEVEELEELGGDGGNALALETWAPVDQGRPRQAGTPETITLSPDQFRSLSLGELAELWREYVAAMAPMLEEARAGMACPAGHRAVQLAGEVRLVVSSLMSANPRGWSMLRAVKMDTEGGVPLMAQPPLGGWRKVYRAMGLSVRQRRLAVAYRNRTLVRMGGIIRARRQLQQHTQQQPLAEHLVSLPGGHDTGIYSPSSNGIADRSAGGIAVAQGLLAASDAAEALRANIADEQLLHNDFLCSVRSVLQPLQSAIAIVHSYPWCPEALAIINCCAEEEGAPTAHELLAGQAPGNWGLAAVSSGQQPEMLHPLPPQWSLT
ncbi:hypothetical protein COCOBI_16-3540 [Coccomyxa sp. Obi]|nr:hypothetical protein COCOBI_16-3540 [Coccomyxa sp. Obi]